MDCPFRVYISYDLDFLLVSKDLALKRDVVCLCVFLLPVGNLENMLLCVKLFLFCFLDDVNCKCTLCA